MVTSDLRRPAQWECPEQSLDHTKLRGTKNYQSISGTRDVARNIRQHGQLAKNSWQDDDNPVRMIVSELLEESRRKIIDGLRLLISVDKYATVKIGDLQKDIRPRK